MAGSIIFQLDTLPPHGNNDMMMDGEFCDNGFIPSIADYVMASDNKDQDIEWLIKTLSPHGITYNKEEQSIVFLKDFKRNYFRQPFSDFQTLAWSTNLDTFSGNTSDINLTLFKLRELIENKFGFYIYEDSIYYSIDDFIRSMDNKDTKYYIYTTLNYHY